MIEFNYKSAVSQARELDAVREDLARLIRRLKTQRAELQTAWKGESADLFVKKTDELFKDMDKTARTMGSIASGVSTAAKVIKEAEEAAKRIAETMTR